MSPSKKSAKRSGSNSSTGTLIVLAVVLLLGAFFILSGKDLLGIFGGSQAVNTTPIVVPTNTPKPIVPPTSTPIPPTDIPTPIPATATKTSPTPRASWWEVYFVSPIRVRQADEEAYGANGLPAELLKGSITEKLIQRIEKAKKTIHIASYEIDIVDVAKALARAKERGVDVRFITDDEAGLEADTKAGHGQLALLKKAGIQVIDDKRGALMHHKFWLFDGETTWTGSTNITISGMFEQDNNVIVIESPELTAIYERQFEDMWAGKFNSKSPSTVDQQTVNIKGTQIQVLFSPEDKAISKIVPYIQNAKKSVHFLAFTYTQPNLGKAMLDKAREPATMSCAARNAAPPCRSNPPTTMTRRWKPRAGWLIPACRRSKNSRPPNSSTPSSTAWRPCPPISARRWFWPTSRAWTTAKWPRPRACRSAQSKAAWRAPVCACANVSRAFGNFYPPPSVWKKGAAKYDSAFFPRC